MEMRYENETDGGGGSGILPRDKPDRGAAVPGGRSGEGRADAADVRRRGVLGRRNPDFRVDGQPFPHAGQGAPGA